MSFLSAIGALAGPVLNAGSNILGSVLSHHDSKANRSAAQSQFDAQMDETLQRRVQDGLKAGINPLAAIGASANVSPTIHSAGGSDTGSFISRAGEHLSKLFERKQEDDIAYDNELKELDLEGKRLENRILRNRAKESELNLASMSKTGSGEEIPNMEPSPNRIGDEAIFRVAYDLQGRPRLIANQNVMEMDSDNAGYISSLKHAISQGFVDKVSGKINNDAYRDLLDDMYYNMYGRHITNLGELYFSPAEAAIAASELVGQIRGK